MSGILSVFAYIPYVVDTLNERTRPERISWLIWSVLGALAFFSQVYEGAVSSLWFAGVQVGATILVFMLSIRYGHGAYLCRRGRLIFLAALIGLIAWYLAETAAYMLAITIGISLLGGWATVRKAYLKPESETLGTWVLALVASVFAVLSVGGFDWLLLAYPLYLLTLYSAIVAAMLLGRARRESRVVARPVFRRAYPPGSVSF